MDRIMALMSQSNKAEHIRLPEGERLPGAGIPLTRVNRNPVFAS
jgi:hypothetical protein